MRRWIALTLLSFGLLVNRASADGIRDNDMNTVRPVPPPGIAVPAADRTELEAGVAELGAAIDGLKKSLGAPQSDLIPDVQIFHNAVRYALQYNEFFSAGEINVARTMLKEGMARANALREGAAPWTTQTGLVVRGYVSKIDGSVQPYGLIVPSSYHPDSPYHHRLDLWFHGRGEVLSELNFLNDRMHNRGEFTPANAFVLHPYGRYCCANKLAGETNSLEAIESVKKRYPIDENRICVRGFSMGGAACWQYATHFAGDWAAAAPGAGFAETPEFLKSFQQETLTPTWYEVKLWRMYNSVDYALNLFNCPTVAYSGELDSQKQAADMMNVALAKVGISMTHVIGLGAHHFYTPAGRTEVSRRIDSILERGRNPVPSHVRFVTYTLHYNKMLWLSADAMTKQWERAEVNAGITRPVRLGLSPVDHDQATGVLITTSGVEGLTLSFAPGQCPLDVAQPPSVSIDNQTVFGAPPVMSDRSWTAHFRRSINKVWSVVADPNAGPLHKRPNLQGPIDDAFMDHFLMVSPTGAPMNAMVGEWTAAEEKHAITEWRRQFRGEAQVKNDTDVNVDDIANANLVLWGDPSSNKILARIANRLPIRWDAAGVHVNGKTYAADHNAPILVFPNPLNPNRYVVLNSGFTYREYDYLDNARQVPKLPDWAIVDLTEKPNTRWPGKIADAGFFDEQWRLTAK